MAFEGKMARCSRNSQARILLLAPTLPFFDKESGGNRLFEILRFMRKKGLKVTFVCESIDFSHGRYRDSLRKIGIRVFEDPASFLCRVQKDDFNICIVSWHNYASRYMALLRAALPYAKVIVDSVDVHWVRQERGFKARELAIDPLTLAQDKIAEKNVYASADNVWVVTEDDREAVLSELPECSVSVVSNIHRRSRRYLRSPAGDGIIFVGNFRHPPNEGAALWGHQICNAFREKTGQDFVYYVVGDSPTDKIKSLHNGSTVVVSGYVPDLYPYYKKSRVMLAPIIYGSGIKGKICHAICSGLAVITTTMGNEGLDLADGKEALLANTTEEFIEKLQLVFGGEASLGEMANRALAKVLNLTGETQVGKSIEAALIYKPVVLAIVSHNKKELLRRCLDSIIAKTDYPDYKIAVVSNGCNDGSLQLLRDYSKRHRGLIDVYYNKKNEFFVAPNNYIIHRYKSRDVVLVNNDIEIVSEKWLLSLHDAVYTSSRVGAAGGKILDGNGRLAEAGAALFNDGRGINFGRGDAADGKEYARPRYVGYASGCLLYMRRDMIERFGPLDKDFSPMYYEDSAWQYMLHRQGILTIYAPGCMAIHYEGSSAGVEPEQGMKRYQEINRKKFLRKFAGIEIESLNPK